MHITGDYLRLTLAEFRTHEAVFEVAYPDKARKLHLVLWETEAAGNLGRARDLAHIISVEDIAGVTIAVLKHRTGETWDRRKPETAPGLRGRSGTVLLRDDIAPVVPRRDPPYAAPAGPDRFQRGLGGMRDHLRMLSQVGDLRELRFQIEVQGGSIDTVALDGEIALSGLAKAFLDAYQPQITISDEVRFKQAKRAMKLAILRARRQDQLDYVGCHNASKSEEQVNSWDDQIDILGPIDIDALGRAFWSVMKG